MISTINQNVNLSVAYNSVDPALQAFLTKMGTEITNLQIALANNNPTDADVKNIDNIAEALITDAGNMAQYGLTTGVYTATNIEFQSAATTLDGMLVNFSFTASRYGSASVAGFPAPILNELLTDFAPRFSQIEALAGV